MVIPTNWGPPSIADSLSDISNAFTGFVKDRQVGQVLGNLPRTPSGAVDYQAAAQQLMRIDPKAAAALMQHGQFETNKAFQQQQFGLQERQFASTEQHQRAQEQLQRDQLAALEAQRKAQLAQHEEQLYKPQVIERENPETGDKETFLYKPRDGSLTRIDIPFAPAPKPAVPAPTVPPPTSTIPQPQKRSDIQQTEGLSLVAETTDQPAPPKPAVATDTVEQPPETAGGAVPTAKDIAWLRAHPDQAAGFDKHFNSPGAAAAFLGAPQDKVDALVQPQAAPAQQSSLPPSASLALPPGTRAKDAREAQSAYVKELAKKRADALSAKVTAGQNVEGFIPSINGALQAFQTLAQNDAIGPWQGNAVSQLVQRYGTSNPLFQNSKWGQMAKLRDEYNMHAANLKLMQAQILMKGQGAISDNERRLLSMTLPELDTTNAQAGIARLQDMVKQMQRIQAEGQVLGQ